MPVVQRTDYLDINDISGVMISQSIYNTDKKSSY